MAKEDENTWVISDGEDENNHEEMANFVKDLLIFCKNRVESESVVDNSEITETDKLRTVNKEFNISQRSSQSNLTESNTSEYYTANENNTEHCTHSENNIEYCTPNENNTEYCTPNKNNSEYLAKGENNTSNEVLKDSTVAKTVSHKGEASKVNIKLKVPDEKSNSKSCSTQNLISDEEEELDSQVNTERTEPKPNSSVTLSESCSSEYCIANKNNSEYFADDENNTPNDVLNDSVVSETISDEEEPSEVNTKRTKSKPKLSKSSKEKNSDTEEIFRTKVNRKRIIYSDDEDEDSEIMVVDEDENRVITHNSRNNNAQTNLVFDEEESDNEVDIESNEPDPKKFKCLKKKENIKSKFSQIHHKKCINVREYEDSEIMIVDEDENSVITRNSKNDKAQTNLVFDEEESDNEVDIESDEPDPKKFKSLKKKENIKPKIRQIRHNDYTAVCQDENEDSELMILDDSENSIAKDYSKNCNTQKNSGDKAKKGSAELESKKKTNWWEEFETVPENKKCKVQDCSFATRAHKKHGSKERVFSLYETRLIISYLIHHDKIDGGAGVNVWVDFQSSGYLQHRTIESLKNHFKRKILRDIEIFKLPKDIEEKFLEQRNSSAIY